MSAPNQSPSALGLAERPEHPLEGRHRLAFAWIPANCERLLDAGCAWGYATRYFASSASSTSGIDSEAEAIAVARQRYPDIEFSLGALEELPYDDRAFDVVVCCDTLEHVADERRSLNELWRVLAPGGTLILTTPHAGLFSWLDPANYPRALRRHLARRAPRLFAAIQRSRKKPVLPMPEYEWTPHRHYSLADFHRLFMSTDVAGEYRVDRVRRSGLLIFPLALTITSLAPRSRSSRWSSGLRIADWLAEREYRIPFGPLAYNIAVRVVKVTERNELGSSPP